MTTQRPAADDSNREAKHLPCERSATDDLVSSSNSRVVPT